MAKDGFFPVACKFRGVFGIARGCVCVWCTVLKAIISTTSFTATSLGVVFRGWYVQ